MDAPAPDLDALETELDALRLRRYELEAAGADWDDPAVYELTWRISGLVVDHGRMLAAVEHAEILRLANLDLQLERSGG